jgi:glycosyltransferase involved in cell wall biosynthesis
MAESNQAQTKIAIFAPYYIHVGTEKVMLTFAQGFAERGYKVDLLRAYQEWPGFSDTDNIRLVDLNARHLVSIWPGRLSYRLWNLLLTLELLPKLTAYIRREKPDVLITGLLSAVAVWARGLSRGQTKIIISVQGLPRPSILRKLVWNTAYPLADAIVVPSEDIVKRLPEKAVFKARTIYNPVIDESVLAQALQPVEHPWFQPDQPPVILGVGRLTRQKNFQTLLRAFAIICKKVPSRLVILGEGEERNELEALARELNISEALCLPGFVKNPYGYMSKARVFVLSSRWEGPGHVLIEALSTGTPVVSTACPYGPREILLDGKLGSLVRIGDEQGMADAVLTVLENSEHKEKDRIRRQDRAKEFSPEAVIRQYAGLVDEIAQSN